jgi:toxin ParE1/3/4
MSKQPFDVLVADPAALDITEILNRSGLEFGESAKGRYEALIAQGIIDIGQDPRRPGAKSRPELLIPGAYTYHLSFSRSRVTGRRVRAPRHFLLYRICAPSVVELGRVLDEGVDLVRHLPKAYRRGDGDS